MRIAFFGPVTAEMVEEADLMMGLRPCESIITDEHHVYEFWKGAVEMIAVNAMIPEEIQEMNQLLRMALYADGAIIVQNDPLAIKACKSSGVPFYLTNA